jgi:hypothetical protein
MTFTRIFIYTSFIFLVISVIYHITHDHVHGGIMAAVGTLISLVAICSAIRDQNPNRVIPRYFDGR